MSETQIIVMPDGAEMEAPVDAPKAEIKRRIGNYLKTLPQEQIDAIPTATRKSFGLGVGDVAKAALKRLPNMIATETERESKQDTRDLWAQGVREIGTPLAAMGVGIATGGLGLAPALYAAAGTGAAGELASQAVSRSGRGGGVLATKQDEATEIAKQMGYAAALEATGELGGRVLAAGIQKVVARRLAQRTAVAGGQDAADNLAKEIGFPRASGAAKHIQEKLNARKVEAVKEYGDAILADLGGGLSAEMQGAKFKTVFEKIDDVFVEGARNLRSRVVGALGDIPLDFRRTYSFAADLEKSLAKRPIKKGILTDHLEALRNIDTLDDALAFRTDLGRNAASLSKKDPARSELERLYGELKEDIYSAVRAKSPDLADALRESDEAFSEFYGGVRNRVIGGMVRAAKEGDGTAVVAELEKASPVQIREMFDWISKTAPAELTGFVENVQRSTAQRILGVTEDGAPTLGIGLSKRLNEIGGDRLREIFGRTPVGDGALRRINDLADLTARHQKDLKIPPQTIESANIALMRNIANAASIAGLATYGGAYGVAIAAARGTKLATDAALEFVLKRPALYRQLSSGMEQVYASASARTAGAADLLVKSGLARVNNAVRVAAREAIRDKGRRKLSALDMQSQAQAAR